MMLTMTGDPVGERLARAAKSRSDCAGSGADFLASYGHGTDPGNDKNF